MFSSVAFLQQDLCWCLWLPIALKDMLLPGFLSVTWDHATARVKLIWVAYTATRAMLTSKPKFLPRAVSGSMTLLQCGLYWLPWLLSHQRFLGKNTCWSPRAVLSRPAFTGSGISSPVHPWTLQQKSWPHSSWESEAHTQERWPYSLPWVWMSWPWWHGLQLAWGAWSKHP